MASVTRTAVVPLQGGVGYELTGHEQWTPDAVTVYWDGTFAASNFVVAVSYYNAGGALIDRAFPEGVTNVPGDFGHTFFRPFKRGTGGTGGGSGIQFDVDNEGDWLEVGTSGAIPGGDIGQHYMTNGADYQVDADAGQVELTGHDILLIADQHAGMFGIGGGIHSAVLPQGLFFNLTAGSKVMFVNHLQQPLFEIHEDGSLHGKTGQSLTFDL